MVSFIIVVSSKFPLDILLIFQPPYSPELNPIERVWQYIKQKLSWGLYDNLDEIKEKVRSFLEEFSSETIASIAGWDYILSALASVA
ncbi:MAG: transposase [Tolypothrix sp. Co-bin9]|nr:transposase [Tolypothrix sp. Co-bin9]